MPKFLGEYDVKADSKGRVRLPSDLLRQMGEGMRYTFIVNRGIDTHLVLYPKTVWERVTQEIDKLNTYVKKNRDFVRYFYRGATELSPDKTDRILLPKRLMEYAKLEGKLVLFAYQDRIEIWSSKQYEDAMDQEPEDFADLAQDVMGENNADNSDK